MRIELRIATIVGATLLVIVVMNSSGSVWQLTTNDDQLKNSMPNHETGHRPEPEDETSFAKFPNAPRGQLKDDVTIVTAYFNIGSFAKFADWDVYTPKRYHDWMKVFARIESPVVGFFDNDDDMEAFLRVRRRLSSNLTVVHKVDRSTMWAFSLIPDIKRIFNKPGYPQYKPNTVVPTYSAAMHAKYEVMQQAIEENAFRTKYFCWLDIGLFRDIATELANAPRFPLYLPKDFRSDSVAYQEVWDPRDPRASVEQIVKNNMVWVCGCFFIAEATVMYRWTQEYKEAVNRMIHVCDLMNTDQQVIYAAFNWMNVTTKIQTYRADGRYSEWFHLGYLARDAGMARRLVMRA